MMRRLRPARRSLVPVALLAPLGLVGCFGLSDEEEQRLVLHQQNSKSFYDSGNMAAAEQQARKGLELDDDDTSLQLILAYILLRSGNAERLLEADDVLAGLSPWWFQFWADDDYKVLLGRGIVRHQLARFTEEAGKEELAEEYREEAREFFAEVIELEPSCIEAHFQLATIAFSEEDFASFGSRTETTVELIEHEIAFKDHLYPMIEEEHQRAANRRERETEARRAQQLLRYRAEQSERQGRLEEAIADLDRLEQMADLSSTDFYNRASYRSRLARTTDRRPQRIELLEQATADYDHFIRVTPHTHHQVGPAIEERLLLQAELAELRTAMEIEGGGVGRG